MTILGNSIFKRLSSLPVLLLIGSMCSLSIGTSLAKQLFPAIGAEGATALRLTYATIILCIVFRPWRYQFNKKDLSIIIPYGIALGGMNLSFYKSLETIPFGVSVALEFVGPLTLAIFSSRRYVDYFWILLVVVGLALLLPLHSDLQTLKFKGVTFALLAGGFWAVYIIFGKKCSSINANQAITEGMTVATILALPFALYHSGLLIFSYSYLPIGLVAAVLSSAVPYTLEMLALKKLSRKNFSILLSLEPVICAIAGIFLLHEWLSISDWIAILLIIIASVGSVRVKQL